MWCSNVKFANWLLIFLIISFQQLTNKMEKIASNIEIKFASKIKFVERRIPMIKLQFNVQIFNP